MIKLFFNKINCTLLFACCFIASSEYSAAQKADTLSSLRDFVNISTGYKQMPLYLELEVKSSTNFITNEGDTSDINGEFYLRNENSYIRIGEFEQIVNDSLALLVSNGLQRMILYTDAASTVKKIKGMMGLVLPDSSIRHLATQYRSFSDNISTQTSRIELQSRTNLYGTNLSRETIELQYDVTKKIPQKITTLKRNLLRLDSLQYARLQNEAGITEQLLTIEGSYFLVKEQITVYLFKQIEKASAAVKVPVFISDRITRNGEGKYQPVKNYKSYSLTTGDE